MASEWKVHVSSLVPQGQLGEVLVVGRVDRTARTVDVMTAKMEPAGTGGNFPMPDGDSPLASFGIFSEEGGFTPLLQAFLDCAWDRGLRPSGFKAAGELKAIRTTFEDLLRRLPPTDTSVTSDIGTTDEDKSW